MATISIDLEDGKPKISFALKRFHVKFSKR